MLKVGITGGIGSGKTTVCKIFELLGIAVYYADTRAKYLITHDPNLRDQIITHFGSDAYGPDGSYNTSYMAKIVFTSKEKLHLLNTLVHPVVARDGEAWLKSHSEEPYTLKEAALLFESGSYKSLDRILFVSAPVELRIARVMARDNITREEVLQRINNQWPDKTKEEMSDEIIYNDEQQSLIRQVYDLHKQLLSMVRSNEPPNI